MALGTALLAALGVHEPVHTGAEFSKSHNASDTPGVVPPHGSPAYVTTPVKGEASCVNAEPHAHVAMAGRPQPLMHVAVHAVMLAHTASAVGVHTVL